MDQAKHDALGQGLSYEQRTRLTAVATQGKVTLHALVTALLGRDAPPDAQAAADQVPPELRATVQQVAQSWPWTCSFCHHGFARLTGRCPHCDVAGCIGCVNGEGCPPCRQRIQAAHAAATEGKG